MTKIIPFNKSDDDHNPIFDIDTEKLMEADAKLKSISQAKEEVLQNSIAKMDNVTVAADGETIIHKRSIGDYHQIWGAFVDTEAKDFETAMGFGREEIERIGIFKFVDAYDWRNASEVSSWRTDKMHIIICPHCKSEFGIFENFGLCHNCRPHYDLEALKNVIVSVNNDYPGLVLQQIAQFIYDDDVRKMYYLQGDIV